MVRLKLWAFNERLDVMLIVDAVDKSTSFFPLETHILLSAYGWWRIICVQQSILVISNLA